MDSIRKTPGLNDLAQYLKDAKPGSFQAQPYYEPETDSLIYYFRDEQSYSKRITKHLTLFLSCNDDSLVGCEMKGIGANLRAALGLA